MCNRYRLDVPPDMLAAWFRADSAANLAISTKVERGSPGLIISDGRLKRMHWGLPNMSILKDARRFDPLAMSAAHNVDKDSWMGRDSFLHRRCLVPMTALEIDAPQGSNWLAAPNSEVFACAGVWRDTLQIGPVFTLVLENHDCTDTPRPVVLARSQYTTWLFGRAAQADAICAGKPLLKLRANAPPTAPQRMPVRA